MTIQFRPEQERLIDEAIQAGLIDRADQVLEIGLEAPRSRLEARGAGTGPVTAEEYVAGPNADFVDLNLLESHLQDMVKMSPLQGSFFELVPISHDLVLIGAAVSGGLPPV